MYGPALAYFTEGYYRNFGNKSHFGKFQIIESSKMVKILTNIGW
jgi:hypothetical protein